jgi:hypothetical protein
VPSRRGHSVYRRYGGVRYATHGQLTLEERIVAQAAAQGAPRLTRAVAAQALGADFEQLERALTGDVGTAENQQRAATGLPPPRPPQCWPR